MSFQSKLKEAAEKLAAMAKTRISIWIARSPNWLRRKPDLSINGIVRGFLWSVLRIIELSMALSTYAHIAG